MKKTKQGFVNVRILITIVLGLVIIGGGAYFIVRQQATSQNSLSNTQETTSPVNLQIPEQTKKQDSINSQTPSPISNQQNNTQQVNMKTSESTIQPPVKKYFHP